MIEQKYLKDFSKNQLHAVMHRNKHLIVTAGAGSGKTRVLTHRFAALVAEGKAGVDEILTLTFTRKAAGEMKARIYQILLEWGKNDKIIEEQMHLFDQAQISTIDSFCAQVLKQSPGSFGLNPDFVQDADRLDDLSQQVSVEYLKETLQNPGVMALKEIVRDPDDWLSLLAMVADRSVLAEESHCHETSNRFLDDVRFYFDKVKQESKIFLHNPDLLSRMEEKKTSVTSQKLQEAMRLLKSFLDEASVGIEELEKISIKNARGEIQEDVKEFLGLVRRICVCTRFLAHPERWSAIHLWLDGFTQKVRISRQKEGVLSFNDISTLAVKLLTINKEIRGYYKKKFKYILIDEFQDNNELQKNLLFLLSEKPQLSGDGIPGARDLQEGKLFFVGDVKQSIYGFRDADVRVLKNLQKELCDTCEAVMLDENYRSSPALVGLTNAFFSVLITGGNGEWEASWTKAEEGRIDKMDSDFVLYVSENEESEKQDGDSENEENSLWTEASDTASTRDRAEIEAYKTAELIRKIVDDKKQVCDSKTGARDVRFDDIAVLVRHLSHQYRYEKAFKLYDIPFEVNEPRNFFLEPVASDFYSYFKILLYPDDRQSWAAVLRSPFVNLDDDTLVRVLKQNTDAFDPSLLALMDQKKRQNCFDLYRELRASFRSMTLTELVRILWVRGGYQFYILNNPSVHSCLDFYYYLEAFAADHEKRDLDLGDFTAFLHQRIGGTQRIKDINVIRPISGGVKLMTIHGSKGLEFPVVILSDTDKGDGNKPKMFQERDGSLVCDQYFQKFIGKDGKKDFEALLGISSRKDKELAELKRMIYVAMTRACDHLYVFALSSEKGKEDSMGAMIRDAWRSAFGEERPVVELPKAMVLPRLAKSALTIVPAGELLSFYEANRFFQSASPSRAIYSASLLEVGKIWEGGPLFCELEHPWLKNEDMVLYWGQWIHDSIRAIGDKTFSLQRNWPLEWQDFSEEIQEQTAETVDMFYSSKLWKNAVKMSTISWERPICLSLDRVEFNGRLDLVAWDGNKAIVIDFKTDRQAWPQGHREQLSVYASALRGMGFEDVEGWVYYCRKGLSVAVSPMTDGELGALHAISIGG